MKSSWVCCLFVSVCVSTSAAPVSLVDAYSQNFDTLALSGTSSSLPGGWAMLEVGSSANYTYTAGTGSASTGDTYSFGLAGSTDRALGTLRTGSVIPAFGVVFENGGAGMITSLLVAYTGEQWRLGSTGREDRLDFQYSLNASSLNTGTWVDVNELDFIAPWTTGGAGLRNGEDPRGRTMLSFEISGLSIAPASTFWFRWTDLEAPGGDDGLAVDWFSIAASSQSIPDSGTDPSPVPENLPSGYGVVTLLGTIFLGVSRIRLD